jgi:hypothetical protein
MAKSLISGQQVDEDNPFAAEATGMGFGNPFEAEMLSPSKRQEQYVAEVLQAEEERTASENPNWTAKDMVGVARSLVDSLWLNKGEELGTLAAAVGIKATSGPLPPIGPVAMLFNIFQGDKSVSDIQDEMLTSERAKSATFAEERPIASIASNVVGGILSPVSLAGGSLINSAMQLRKGQQAVQGGIQVADALPSVASASDELARMGAMYGRQQSGAAASTLARVPTPVAASGLAALEGGVIGFEGDTLEDKVTNAAFTAGISAAVPFAFAGVKKGYDVATESTIAQQLGEGADFINLMFTEHGLAPVYRSVISKAYGGRGLSEQQARSMVARVPTPRSVKDTAIAIKDEAARKIASVKNIINKSKEETIFQAKEVLDSEVANIKTQAASAVGEEKTRLLNRITELEQIKGDSNLLKFEASRQADEAVNAANGSFRGQVLNSSVPAGATADDIAALGSLNPQDANNLLDDLWKTKGFTFANGKNYPIDPEDIEGFIDNTAKEYPELSLVEGGSIIPRIKQYISQTLAEEAPDGVIEGRALVNLRSQIGRAINGLSDDKTSTRGFSSEVQEYFHDVLGTQLNKAEKAAFDADRTAWGVRSLVDDATAKASGGDARSGAFTPQDFLISIRSYSPRFAARGAGRFQKEAQELVELTKQNEKNILDLADKNIKDIAKDVAKNKNSLRVELENTKTQVKKQQQKEIADLVKTFKTTKADARNSAARRTAVEELKSKHQLQLRDIDNKIETAANEAKAIAELMPGNFRGSVFENLFNTALVGQTVQAAGGGFGGVSSSIGATLATGVLGSSILAKEVSQRILAKQTSGQAAIRNLVGGITDSVQKVVPEGAGQIGTGAAAAIGTSEYINPTEPLFTKERRKLLMNLPVGGKAALYRNLESKGQLKRLQAEDPGLFKLLKAAYNR